MFEQRKCEKCGRPATFKFTRIVNGKAVDCLLCEEHAVDNSPYVQKQPAPETIKAWLKGIVANVAGVAAETGDIPDIQCDRCGLKYEAYKRTLLLGCPDCYRSFEEHLLPELRKFHGEIRHVGRTPLGVTTPDKDASSAGLPLKIPTKKPAATAPRDEDDSPLRVEEPSSEQLRGNLEEAVKREDFEEAARLRDRIRQIETN
jgi:protein arginine kinase activator